MFTIERATTSHLPELTRLFDLYRQFYHQTPGQAAEFIKARMNNQDSVIFIALDESANGLGFTQLYPAICSVEMAPFYVLYDLYVDAAARRHGVANALMDKARQHAIDTGAIRLDLETAVDNLNAQKLYEELGYRRDTKFYKYSLDLRLV